MASKLNAANSVTLLLGFTAAVLGLYTLLGPNRDEKPVLQTPETVAPWADGGEEEPEYDVIIVGGGTAGCVLASRLSENPKTRVLLLEAGGSSRTVMESVMPASYGRIFHTKNDHKLWTEPQVHADNLKKYWPRGKMLGGCSASNAMMFHTGAPTDYDEWARTGLEGAEQWSHKNLLPYFHKFETFVPSSKYPGVDVSVRGKNGPMKVGYFGHIHSTSRKWMDGCRKLGIPFNPDLNHPVGGSIGVTKISKPYHADIPPRKLTSLSVTYIDSKGRRVTTENAYLTPEVLKRPNLRVAVHSQVTRILIEVEGETKKAVGVEFARSKGGPRYRVRSKQQIVLAAGAIHSPHILMLSGIGPKDHLEKHGIACIHNLPGVGQNLQDHVSIATRFRVREGQSLQFIFATKGKRLLQALAALAQWKSLGTGPLSTNLAEAAAFVRSDDLTLIPTDKYKVEDESSGRAAPDIELIITPIAYPIAKRLIPEGDLITLLTILLRPQSRGSIKLRSNNPFDAPIIDPKYFEKPNDVAVLVRGLKLAVATVKSEPLASVVLHDDDPLLDHNLDKLTDTELEAEVRKRPETLYHPTTTCRMAKLEDGGVVDAYLRVHGVEDLRITDASIFSRIVSGHTAAPSIAVGEKASDLIKASLQL